MINLQLSRSQLIALILIPSIFFVAFLSPLSLPLDNKQLLSACLILSALVLLATSAISEHLSMLIFMTAAMLLAIAPAEVVFSGFSSTACWLIFSGLIIGIAVNETGLAKRIGNTFTGRLDKSYTHLISGIVLLSILLGFLMPSSIGRAVLLIPIAMAMGTSCGFKEGSNGQIGVALAAAFGCHVPTFAVLPANVPNMVLIGAAETMHNWTPMYAEYLLLHFPVLGFIKALLIIAVIVWLFPDTPTRSSRSVAKEPVSKQEYKLMVIMMVTLGFWLTDSLHHISAAWIGLAAVCILLMPRIGVVSQQSFQKKFNISSLVFVVGVLGVGALINYSGIGDVVGEQLNTWLPLSSEHPLLSYLSLSLTAFTTGMVATLPGVPAILTPFAEQMSDKSGFTLEAVLMTQVLGFSTILFPFQSAPLMVGMQLAGVSIRHAAKLCFVLTPITILVLFPLDYLWWKILGWL
ncbi:MULTISPECIES: SLC13 family permease [unclassified Neptuniibacter]|jgi:di/tricarboxylate transporter|uniref:SLC13 family permease n=1 Tax=unclassified Neptuniibacter TaxID=2630693 RepID=UPI0026E3A8BD|nr:MULTISPECIES: SLC13 family permease [unclassified Neptuniibacter]MDO6513418.1 SLC13 family permease [Neptuniibacter sp. 2_MG-2023]MDO6593947.1 SLC13 family permease [Neptuniibacter sp. 1_MG-2023]